MNGSGEFNLEECGNFIEQIEKFIKINYNKNKPDAERFKELLIEIKNEIIKIILKFSLKDNVKARELHPDMSYTFCKCENGETRIDSQEYLMSHALKSISKFTKSKL